MDTSNQILSILKSEAEGAEVRGLVLVVLELLVMGRVIFEPPSIEIVPELSLKIVARLERMDLSRLLESADIELMR